MTLDPNLRYFQARPDMYETEGEVLACSPTEDGWQVQVAPELFHPTGGGQAHDLGGVGDAVVRDVQERDGSVWLIVDRCVPLGPVRLWVDRERRQGHMCHHSGQHIVSGIVWALYGLPTLGIKLGVDSAQITVSRPLAKEELEAVQERMDLTTRSPVGLRQFVLEESPDPGFLRRRPGAEGLPDRPRVVEYPGLDRTLCSGTHVVSTADLAPFLLVGQKKATGGRGVIEIVAGKAGSRRFREDTERAEEITALLGRAPAEHLAGIAALKHNLAETESARTHAVATILAWAVEPMIHSGVGRIDCPWATTRDLARLAEATRRAGARVVFVGSGATPDIAAGGPEPELLELERTLVGTGAFRGKLRAGVLTGRLPRPILESCF